MTKMTKMAKIEECLQNFRCVLGVDDSVLSEGFRQQPLFHYVHPEVMFIGGEQTPEPIEDFFSAYCIERVYQVLSALADGEDVAVEYIESDHKLFEVLDCAYGILIQAAAAGKSEDILFPVGKLTLTVDSHQNKILREHEDAVGGVLLNSLRNVLTYMIESGNHFALLLMRQLDDSASFFVPLSNVQKEFWHEEFCDITEPCFNFDLGFGGKLGWYRLQQLLERAGMKSGPLEFPAGDIEEMKLLLSQKADDLEDLAKASTGIVDDHCEDIFEDILKEHRCLYGSE